MKVKIVHVYGTQADIVQTSRVCTGKEQNAQTPEVTASRITDLIKKKHWSPFEFATIVVEIEAPIYVMRQWMRHSGAWMEKSRRYTKDQLQFGEQGMMETDYYRQMYRTHLSDGLTPEDARKDLPLDLMTKCMWGVNLRDVLSFLRQRLDPHAQKEIRELAISLMVQLYKHFPEVVEAFLTYDFGDITAGTDTMFDLYFLQKHGAFAYEGSQKRVEQWGENAERRLKLIKELFTRIAEAIPDGSEAGGSPEHTCADPPEVPEEVGNQPTSGEIEREVTERFFRNMAEAEQEALTKLSEGDSDGKQLQLPFGEEPSVPFENGVSIPVREEALAEFIDPKIVEGHFGSVHSGQSV